MLDVREICYHPNCTDHYIVGAAIGAQKRPFFGTDTQALTVKHALVWLLVTILTKEIDLSSVVVVARE